MLPQTNVVTHNHSGCSDEQFANEADEGENTLVSTVALAAQTQHESNRKFCTQAEKQTGPDSP